MAEACAEACAPSEKHFHSFEDHSSEDPSSEGCRGRQVLTSAKTYEASQTQIVQKQLLLHCGGSSLLRVVMVLSPQKYGSAFRTAHSSEAWSEAQTEAWSDHGPWPPLCPHSGR